MAKHELLAARVNCKPWEFWRICLRDSEEDLDLRAFQPIKNVSFFLVAVRLSPSVPQAVARMYHKELTTAPLQASDRKPQGTVTASRLWLKSVPNVKL